MKNWIVIGLCVALAAMLIAGCTPRATGIEGISRGDEGAAGFWKGLWHGFIVLFTFVISLFREGTAIYEVRNTGALYDLGYILGMMAFFGGGGGGACRKGRRG